MFKKSEWQQMNNIVTNNNNNSDNDDMQYTKKMPDKNAIQWQGWLSNCIHFT